MRLPGLFALCHLSRLYGWRSGLQAPDESFLIGFHPRPCFRIIFPAAASPH
jgi:hypothetical protein